MRLVKDKIFHWRVADGDIPGDRFSRGINTCPRGVDSEVYRKIERLVDTGVSVAVAGRIGDEKYFL